MVDGEESQKDMFWKMLKEGFILGDEEQLMASPAIDGDAFYIRTAKHLYRIE